MAAQRHVTAQSIQVPCVVVKQPNILGKASTSSSTSVTQKWTRSPGAARRLLQVPPSAGHHRSASVRSAGSALWRQPLRWPPLEGSTAGRQLRRYAACPLWRPDLWHRLPGLRPELLDGRPGRPFLALSTKHGHAQASRWWKPPRGSLRLSTRGSLPPNVPL